jgi:hypothetical protein
MTPSAALRPHSRAPLRGPRPALGKLRPELLLVHWLQVLAPVPGKRLQTSQLAALAPQTAASATTLLPLLLPLLLLLLLLQHYGSVLLSGSACCLLLQLQQLQQLLLRAQHCTPLPPCSPGHPCRSHVIILYIHHIIQQQPSTSFACCARCTCMTACCC